MRPLRVLARRRLAEGTLRVLSLHGLSREMQGAIQNVLHAVPHLARHQRLERAESDFRIVRTIACENLPKLMAHFELASLVG